MIGSSRFNSIFELTAFFCTEGIAGRQGIQFYFATP